MSNFDSTHSEKLLFLDVGNTAVKGAFKKEANWEAISSATIRNASDLMEWIENQSLKFSGVVISGVQKDMVEAIQQVLHAFPVKTLGIRDIPFDFLDYETPETLGMDRFLACFGAISQTDKAVVVIDAGTATTIDFMSAEEVFCGGMIAPGISSYMNLLHQKAPALQVVDATIPKNWPGKNTIDSLKWGQAGLYKYGIEKSLAKFEEEFGDFELFLTGGDATKLKPLLARSSKVRPFLIFDGMERLLNIEH